MQKTFLELAKELRARVGIHRRLEAVASLPYQKQPLELFLILFDSLAIADRRRLVAQFGAGVHRGINGWRPHRAEMGELVESFSTEDAALSRLIGWLAEDFSAALFIKLLRNPTMTVAEPLFETIPAKERVIQ